MLNIRRLFFAIEIIYGFLIIERFILKTAQLVSETETLYVFGEVGKFTVKERLDEKFRLLNSNAQNEKLLW
jgi:hypothetical protein